MRVWYCGDVVLWRCGGVWCCDVSLLSNFNIFINSQKKICPLC